MSENPFTFGNPVIDQTLFIGRKNEINQIVSRLRSSAHESTSLIGDSRMGNTSLLKYLANPTVAAQQGMPSDTYCLVYIDFQGQADITPDFFWKRVITSIYRATQNPRVKDLAGEYRKMSEYDLFDLEDFFQEINDLGQIIVLLMDEFEYVTQSPKIGGDFFGSLRSQAIHGNLPLVPATRHPLDSLCKAEEIKGSPFFNIFANVYLSPFSTEDSNLLLDIYLAKTGLPYSEEERNTITYLGDGHPYFLQMAGYYWFCGKEAGLNGQNLREYMLTNCYRQSSPHFKDLWSMSDQREQTLLRAIAVSEKTDQASNGNLDEFLGDRSYDAAMSNLIKRGLVVKSDGKFSVNLPNLSKYLLDEIFPNLETAPQTGSAPDRPPHPSSQLAFYEVFISHSTKDKSTADLVVSGLESKGIQCWIAPRDIQPGTPYPEAIIKALNTCRVMVVIFSKAANESDQVMQEVERGVAKKLTIIPIRIENILPTGSLELMLSSRHWLDAYNTPIGSHIDALARSIRA